MKGVKTVKTAAASPTTMSQTPRKQRDPKLDELIPDMPIGPLDLYRKQAKFDWKEMKFLVEGEDALIYKVSSLILLFTRITREYVMYNK